MQSICKDINEMTSQKTRSIIFCGRIGSGKSLAARILQAEGWAVVSAGSVIADICRKSGLAVDRKALQEFGSKFLVEHGVKYLGKLMLQQSNNSNKTVFEGIRPIGVVREIQCKAESTMIIYIDANPSIRKLRVIDRDEICAERFEQLERNELELSVCEVRSIANRVISNETTIDAFRRSILEIARVEAK